MARWGRSPEKGEVNLKILLSKQIWTHQKLMSLPPIPETTSTMKCKASCNLPSTHFLIFLWNKTYVLKVSVHWLVINKHKFNHLLKIWIFMLYYWHRLGRWRSSNNYKSNQYEVWYFEIQADLGSSSSSSTFQLYVFGKLYYSTKLSLVKFSFHILGRSVNAIFPGLI